MMLQVRAKWVDNQTNQSHHPDSQTNHSYQPEKMEKHYHHHHHHGDGRPHYPTPPCLPPICKQKDSKGHCEDAGCKRHEFSSSFSNDGRCEGYTSDPDADSHSCFLNSNKYKCLSFSGCRWKTSYFSTNGVCDGESWKYCGAYWSADPCYRHDCRWDEGLHQEWLRHPRHR
ncbi:unnamed protein product [Symbiodinium sp. CCMP2592]|nr:unnamed protein product [Symbiodinium sp. CCMP2592]